MGRYKKTPELSSTKLPQSFSDPFESIKLQVHAPCVFAECFVEGGDDKNIPLLGDVFEAFPEIPINVDIKVNDDTLIRKVCAASLTR